MEGDGKEGSGGGRALLPQGMRGGMGGKGLELCQGTGTGGIRGIYPLKGQPGVGKGCPGNGGVTIHGMFTKRADVALGDTG